MSLVGSGLVLAARARCAWRRHLASDPAEIQERTLLSALRHARDTHFGRAHGFDRIRNVRAYRQQVPLRRYAELLPYLSRAMAGEADVSWPGHVRYFGMTSGTVSGNKYLPISTQAIRQQQRGGFDPIATYLAATGDAELLAGKGLLLGGSAALEHHPNGVAVGDNTGIMALHMPRFVERHYLPSATTRRLADWDQKIAAIARESVAQDVRLVAGTPAWFPGLFDAVLHEANARGVRADHVTDVWPNLRLLTGGGIGYEPYRPLTEARLGRAVPYVETYNATEGGIMGVQDILDERAMLMLPDRGVFYELVPLDELEAERPRRFGLWEVELDVPYALAVTTPAGLWSYLIGDCVRFVERFPHRFLFEGRTAAFLNVQGEHVSQAELERAMRAASQLRGVRVAEFTVTADVGVDGGSAARHTFIVEFDGEAPDLDAFAQQLDDDLAKGNADYRTHRNTVHGLRPPAVRSVPAGTFEAWMRKRGKLGAQHKVPRLLLDQEARSLLEQVVVARGDEVKRNGVGVGTRLVTTTLPARAALGRFGEA